jgi:hypothetical protein
LFVISAYLSAGSRRFLRAAAVVVVAAAAPSIKLSKPEGCTVIPSIWFLQMLALRFFSAFPFSRVCGHELARTTPLRPQASSLSTQPPEESTLRKTLLKYRANASKSRDKAVKQAYMQLANDIQAKLNVEAAATVDSMRSQAAAKSAPAVEVSVTGSAKTGVPALKFRLPSSFKPSAGDKSKSGSRKP